MGARVCSLALAVAVTACGRISFDNAGADGLGDGAARSYPAAVLADHPRAYYRLGDAQGALLLDQSGNLQHADAMKMLDGQVTMGMPGALPGDSDTATYFNGTGNAGNGSEGWGRFPGVWPTWAGDFTIEAFVKTVSAPAVFEMSFVLCEQYTVDGFRTGWSSMRLLDMWSHQSGGTAEFNSGRSFAANAWTHIAIVHRGGLVDVYFDGQADGTFPFTYISPSAAATCGIGSYAGMPSDMVVDELAIYDSALSQAQVAAHFAASGR